MCGSPDRSYNTEEKYIKHLIERANQRTQDDKTKSSTDRPHVTYRGDADLCYAYSTRDEYYYIGYSGSAGGINPDRNWPNKDEEQVDRRMERLKHEMERLKDERIAPSTDPNNLRRPICNCAEACALSIANSYNQHLRDLVFVTFYPRSGQAKRVDRWGWPIPKNPCRNCQTWLRDAAGYYNDGTIKCNRC